MKHPLIINSHGKITDRKPKVHRSLPYYNIPRRTKNSPPAKYDRDIDVYAVVI
jgi:hypothetical protein